MCVIIVEKKGIDLKSARQLLLLVLTVVKKVTLHATAANPASPELMREQWILRLKL